MPTALTTNADITIRIVRSLLSDNSEVFDVSIDTPTLNAATESDAEALAEAIATAIDKHTTNVAEIRFSDGAFA